MLLVSISIVGDLILKKDCHHYHVCAILYACQSIKYNGKFDDILNVMRHKKYKDLYLMLVYIGIA